MLKSLICLALLGMSLTAFAQVERVTCKSDDNRWDVRFTLDKDVVTNLSFYRDQKPYRFYEKAEGQRIRIFKREFFEFDLGSPRYLDFERRMGQKTFVAVFFLRLNPFTPEHEVICHSR